MSQVGRGRSGHTIEGSVHGEARPPEQHPKKARPKGGGVLAEENKAKERIPERGAAGTTESESESDGTDGVGWAGLHCIRLLVSGRPTRYTKQTHPIHAAPGSKTAPPSAFLSRGFPLRRAA